jgi:hypothetical protein
LEKYLGFGDVDGAKTVEYKPKYAKNPSIAGIRRPFKIRNNPDLSLCWCSGPSTIGECHVVRNCTGTVSQAVDTGCSFGGSARQADFGHALSSVVPEPISWVLLMTAVLLQSSFRK